MVLVHRISAFVQPKAMGGPGSGRRSKPLKARKVNPKRKPRPVKVSHGAATIEASGSMPMPQTEAVLTSETLDQSVMHQEGSIIMKRRRFQSKVWVVFDPLARLKPSDLKYQPHVARCRICPDGHEKKDEPYHPRTKEEGVTTGSGTATTLVLHCEKLHPLEYKYIQRGHTLEEALELAEADRKEGKHLMKGPLDPFVTKSPSVLKVNENVLKDMWVRWIVECDLPFRTVERKSFRRWTALVCPGVTWSRHSVRERVIQMWRKMRHELKRTLAAVPGKISFTTDLWTSRTAEAYMCITAHWLDSEWNHQSSVLDFVELPGSHTAELIKTKFLECLTEFGVQKRIMAITLDNASSNKKFVQLLEQESDLGWSRYYHVECIAHVINIAVQAAVQHPNIERVLDKLRYLARWINKSQIRTTRFRKVIRKKVGDTQAKKLFRDCPTRWSSTYFMIQRALQLRTAIDEHCKTTVVEKIRDVIKAKKPTSREWDLVKKLSCFLGPFEEATRFAEGSNYATIHVLLQTYNMLMDKIDAVKEAMNGTILSDVIKAAKTKLLKYYNNSSELLTVATALDPTMKTGWCDYSHISKVKIPEKEKEAEKEKNELEEDEQEGQRAEADVAYTEDMVRSEFLSVFKNYSHIVRPVVVVKSKPHAKKVPRLGYMREARKHVATTNQQKKRESEAIEYLMSAVVVSDDDEDVDILQWWKGQEYVQPAVAAMAKDFLAIQATSAPSERAFSLARHVVTEFRGSLAPSTIRAILCLKSWLKDKEEAIAGDDLDYDSDGDVSEVDVEEEGIVEEEEGRVIGEEEVDEDDEEVVYDDAEDELEDEDGEDYEEDEGCEDEMEEDGEESDPYEN